MKNASPVVGWGVLVLVASFLTWGTFQTTVASVSGELFGGLFGGLFKGFNPLGAVPLKVTLSGWSGNITLLGMALPNWLAVVAALAATFMSNARASGSMPFNRLAPAALAIYALGHVAFLVAVVLSKSGTLGIGALLMIVGLLGILASLFKMPNATPKAATPV